jgi:glycosyltransferase involved in cell wall biosynthesis
VVDVVLPARDVATTIGAAVQQIPARRRRSVIVVDYGSCDATAQIAQDAGAVVLRGGRGGYGSACQRAVEHVTALPAPPDIVVFAAADGSDDLTALERLVDPIAAGDAELAIAVVDRPERQLSSAVALRLIRTIYRHRFNTVGGFRAIRLPALVALGMSDSGSGWNAEMQVKSLRIGLHIVEVPLGPGPIEPAPRSASLSQRVYRDVGATGRVLMHILRHSTAR